jgi:hypothetical protein
MWMDGSMIVIMLPYKDPATTYVVLVEVFSVEVVLVVVLVEVVFVVVFVLVGGMSQIVPLGSLTHCKVFKLQQVTPGQS